MGKVRFNGIPLGLKHSVLAFLCLLLLPFLAVAEAEAHSPYSRPIQTMEGPHGEHLLLEYLYADGILGPDPVRIQLINQYHVVLAYAEKDSHASYYCPSLKFCWVFSYHSFLVNPWRLDYEHLDYGAKTQDQHNEDLYDPQYGKEHVKGFVEGPAWLKVLSPLIVTCDNWLAFLVAVWFCFLPAFFMHFFRQKVLKQSEQTNKSVFQIAGVLLNLAYFVSYLIATFILAVILSKPVVYLLLYAGVGLLGGDRFGKWISQRQSMRELTITAG